MNKVLKYIFYLISIITFIALGWWGNDIYQKQRNQNGSYKLNLPIELPLEKYSIENLSKSVVKPVEIKYKENIFSFEFDPTLQNKQKKKVTGLINTPNGNGPFPLIVLIRGYVDQSIYTTGTGTKRVGEYLSENGYITLAPDFLGYGGSDPESGNIFESRFQTYTTALTLFKSISTKNIPNWDGKNIFIWAHSNGGQIALTVLEITGAKYPTILWAPVSKAFPYSVLYYTDESEDHGKLIRNELSKFEQNYNVDEYSLTNYLERINAPIELHQGTNDDAIPVEWSNELVNELKFLNKDINYYKHPGADHNMNPLWGDVIYQGLNFFNSNLQKTP